MIGSDISSDTFEADQLTAALTRVATAIAPQPLYLSLTDNSPVPDESHGHRLLGYRGAIRHISEPDNLRVELEAIHKARGLGATNVHLTLPFVRTSDELHRLQSFLAQHDLTPDANFRVGLLCQTPANVIMLEQYLHEGGLQFVTIDLDTLTELTVGIDRQHESGQSYQMNNEAVLISLKHCLELCHHHGIATNVVGDNLENNPELLTELVRMGATAVTVPLSDVTATRQLIASAEQRLLLDHALSELHEAQ